MFIESCPMIPSGSPEDLSSMELCALQILELLPGAQIERTRDVIQLNYGTFRDETGIVVLITPEAIELRLPTIIGLGSQTIISSSTLWKRVEWKGKNQIELCRLITSAQLAQQQSFGYCQHCGSRKPAAWMVREDLCESCAHLMHPSADDSTQPPVQTDETASNLPAACG